jgi:SAM-dependent methyltransferase
MNDTAVDPALAAAESYESNVVTHATGPFAAILVEEARPIPGERALDVACGTGTVARQIAPHVAPGGSVVAVDINPAMLIVAGRLPWPDQVPVEWREGDAQDLPCADSDFDLVLCQAGLMFVPDRGTALGEMYRVLRRGGRVALSVWRGIEHLPVAQLIWGTMAQRLGVPAAVLAPQLSLGDPTELRALVDDAGFVDVSIVVRSYTVREPRSEHPIERFMPAMVNMVPALKAMSEEDR